MYDRPMFEGLAHAIEELEIPGHGEALAAAFALRDQLDAKLAAAFDAFDRDGGWQIEGARSPKPGCANAAA